MTVCVAGMCSLPDGSHAIVAATDFLLTDMTTMDQWSPALHKYYVLCDGIIGLFAGAAGVALEIFRETTLRLAAETPVFTVQAAAEALAGASKELIRRDFQRAHLDEIDATLDDITRTGSALMPSVASRLREAVS